MAHNHDVYDTGKQFEINGLSRFIRETSTTKLVLVQGDHKSEVITFMMPRYIDGHDMLLCNKIRVHYINIDTKTNDKSADIYEVTDLTLCEECEEETLTFTWTIEAPATKYFGNLSFLIKFECTEGENILYQWNTAKYVGTNVLAGMDNSEEFVDKYSNVLEEWYNELTRGADSIEELNQQAIAEIELAKEDAKEDIQGKANSTMAAMEQFSTNTYNSFIERTTKKSDEVFESLPEEYGELQEEVKVVDNNFNRIATDVVERQEIIWNEASGYYDQKFEFFDFEGTFNYEISCTQGDVFYLTGQSFGGAMRYIVLDSNDAVLDSDPYKDYVLHINTKITIPYGGSRILLQTITANRKTFVLHKVTDYILKENTVHQDALQDESVSLDKLSHNISRNFTKEVFEDYIAEWNHDGYFNGVIGREPSFNSLLDDGYGYTKIEVKTGEKFFIHTGHSWASTGYFTTDRFGIVLRTDGAPDNKHTEIKEIVEIQPEEKYLYIGYFSFKKLQKNSMLGIEKLYNLTSKKIVYDGDSICESRFGDSSGGAFATLIAEKVHGFYDNHAVGGGILRTLNGTGTSSTHSVVDNLINLPTDGDLYCFEGGINDYWGNATLGTYDKTNFTGELDTTTVCGALETIFRYALNNFVGKPIVFVITHKIKSTDYRQNGVGNTFEDYHNAFVGICNKYSIPYYDAFNESGLNGWNEVQNQKFLLNADGCHPNEEGYKRYYVPQLIDLFEGLIS